MNKDYDLLLNILANPEFSISDFKEAGFTVDNTYLESEDKYKKSAKILQMFQGKDGQFDEKKLHNAYLAAANVYTELSNDKYVEDLINLTTFHRDNIFVPASRRRTGPDFEIERRANPLRDTSSMTRLGIVEESPLSMSEIAQTQKVLVNPTQAYNPDGTINEKKAIWHDAPNDSFFTDFFDTRVLAAWDSDGTHIDPITGRKEKHKKGEYKLNNNGTFFYENLDGRDVYGKQVLNKLNTITTDGSVANKYDFFDSDGKDEKSIMGTTLKNLALVGSMFIPYVGTAVAGASIFTLSLSLLSVLGKMLTSSDNSTLSAIEGWSKSVGRQTLKSEYAQLNMWCWENFIDIAGESIAQLAEQRLLFEKLPRLWKGDYVAKGEAGEKAFKAMEEGKLKTYDQMLKEIIASEKNRSSWEKRLKEMMILKTNKVNAAWDKYLEDYFHLGGILSKSYMVALTVLDTYGEAKLAGASDLEATLLTLGYGAAEAMLLNTGVGEWMFPELRYNKFRLQALMEAASGAKNLTKTYEQMGMNALTLAGKEAKKSYVRDVFALGKNACRQVFGAAKSTPGKVVQQTLANAIGEGTEEVSEEILADVSKGIFNLYTWLTGQEKHINTNWRDGEGNWTFRQMFDDYAMNFLGGFVGGGIGGLSLKNIEAIKSLDGITLDLALLEIAYMIRNKKIDKFVKDIDKASLGYKTLSTKLISKEDGSLVYAPGTKEDNLDLAAKTMLKANIAMLLQIMESEGISMSDDSFLAKQTELLKDVKLSYLQGSASAGKLLLDYNTNVVELLKLRQEYNNTYSGKPDTESEVSEDTKNKLAKLNEEIKMKQEAIKDMLGGKRTAQYASAALFEMTPAISGTFITPTFEKFVEYLEHRPFSEVSDEKKANWLKKYKEIQEIDLKDKFDVGAQMYISMMQLASDTIKNSVDLYKASLQNPVLKELANRLSKFGIFTAINNLTGNNSDEAALATIQSAFDLHYYDTATLYEMLLALGADVSLATAAEEEKARILQDLSLKEEQKALLMNEQIRIFNDSVFNAMTDKLTELVSPFILQGFINTEEKLMLTDLMDLLTTHAYRLIPLENFYLYLEKEIDPQFIATEEELQKINEVLKYYDLDQSVVTLKTLLTELPHTPIEATLSAFTLNVLGKAVDFPTLLGKINTLLNDKFDEYGNFSTNNFNAATLIDDINYALKAIQLFKTALLGSQVDEGDIDNVFGFNKTLNEINKALGISDYQELAEIDYDSAQILLQDTDIIQEKLLFAKQLHALSLGQKLAMQERVATNVNYLIYDKMRSFTTHLPQGWEDKDGKLRAAFDSMELHKHNSESKNKNLSATEEKKLFEEFRKLEDAIYTFFKENSSANLTLLIKTIAGESLLTDPDTLLTEETEMLDDNSFIWWLCAHSAVKASDFYSEYYKILDSGVAPIKTQVIATYNNYASIINGALYDKFFDAYRQAIIEKYSELETPEDRKAFIKKVYPEIDEGSFLDTLAKTEGKYALSIFNVPRYGNIIFTEGIPGSGKTKAVLKSTVLMLKNHKNSADLLKNVVVVHAASLKSAKELQGKKGLELDENKSSAMDHDLFLKYIKQDWKDLIYTGEFYETPEGLKYVRNEYGEWVNSAKPSNSNYPSLIIIDELSNFSLYELDIINQFAKDAGITVLGCGDLDLTSFEGIVKVDDSDISKFNISTSRLSFIRSPKLGVSMRTANNLKNTNFVAMLHLIENPNHALDLHYYQDNRGLFGEKVLTKEHVESSLDYYAKIKEEILKLIATRKLVDGEYEKIGYIYDERSTFKNLVELDFPGIFEFFQGNEALGREGLYYIVDIGESLRTRDNMSPVDQWDQIPTRNQKHYLRALYTGISRSEQGSLIINAYPNSAPFGKNILDDGTVLEGFKEAQIVAYKEKFKLQLTDSGLLGNLPLYVSRRSVPLKNNNNPAEEVEAPKNEELQQQAPGQNPAHLLVLYSLEEVNNIFEAKKEVLQLMGIEIGVELRNTLANTVQKITNISAGTVENAEPIITFENGNTIKFNQLIGFLNSGKLKIAKKLWTAGNVKLQALQTNTHLEPITINDSSVFLEFDPIDLQETDEFEACRVNIASAAVDGDEGEYLHFFKLKLSGQSKYVAGIYDSKGHIYFGGEEPLYSPQLLQIVDMLKLKLSTLISEAVLDTNDPMSPEVEGKIELDEENEIEFNDFLQLIETSVNSQNPLEEFEDPVDEEGEAVQFYYEDDALFEQQIDNANAEEANPEIVVRPTNTGVVEPLGRIDLSTGKLAVDFLSFSAFELGVKVDPNNPTLPIQSAIPERNAARIDSINGLINMYKTLYATGQVPNYTVQLYEEVLKSLHKLGETESDITKIAQKASQILTKFFEQSSHPLTLSANFAVWSTIFPPKTSNAEYFYEGKELINGVPNRNLIFDRSKNEQTKFVNSDAWRSGEPLRSHIDLVLYDNSKHLMLTIPIINFPNPFTVLYKLNDPALSLLNAYVENWQRDYANGATQVTPDRIIALVIQELTRLQNLGNSANYLGLIDLFDYYSHLNNFIVPMDSDWTPAGSLTSSGPKILSLLSINEFYGEFGFKTNINNVPKPISRVRDTSRVQISQKILYALDPTWEVVLPNHAQPIIINVNTGLPFVLVNYGPIHYNDTATMLELYRKEKALLIAGETIVPTIRLVYVSPPKVDVEDYLYNLINILYKSGTLNKKIGNKNTAFNLVKALYSDQLMRTFMESTLGTTRFAILEAKLTEASERDSVLAIRDWLIGGSGENKKFFLSILVELCYPKNSVVGLETILSYPNELFRNLKAIADWLRANTLYGQIRLSADRDYSDGADYGHNVHSIRTENPDNGIPRYDVVIGGSRYEYTMNPNINTPKFTMENFRTLYLTIKDNVVETSTGNWQTNNSVWLSICIRREFTTTKKYIAPDLNNGVQKEYLLFVEALPESIKAQCDAILLDATPEGFEEFKLRLLNYLTTVEKRPVLQLKDKFVIFEALPTVCGLNVTKLTQLFENTPDLPMLLGTNTENYGQIQIFLENGESFVLEAMTIPGVLTITSPKMLASTEKLFEELHINAVLDYFLNKISERSKKQLLAKWPSLEEDVEFLRNFSVFNTPEFIAKYTEFFTNVMYYFPAVRSNESIALYKNHEDLKPFAQFLEELKKIRDLQKDLESLCGNTIKLSKI